MIGRGRPVKFDPFMAQPLSRTVKRAGRILYRPVLGGLHHEYVLLISDRHRLRLRLLGSNPGLDFFGASASDRNSKTSAMTGRAAMSCEAEPHHSF